MSDSDFFEDAIKEGCSPCKLQPGQISTRCDISRFTVLAMVSSPEGRVRENQRLIRKMFVQEAGQGGPT
jgi:hypothetical protein